MLEYLPVRHVETAKTRLAEVQGHYSFDGRERDDCFGDDAGFFRFRSTTKFADPVRSSPSSRTD
jgi:hypothetical protein